MNDKFQELLNKAKPMSEEKAKAAKDVVKQLKAMLNSGLGEKLKGLKKVTVASDSEEGLEEGLEMAKEKVKELNPGNTDDHENNHDVGLAEGTPEHEEMESPKEEKSEQDKIAELEKQLEELKAKKKGTDLEAAKKSIKSAF